MSATVTDLTSLLDRAGWADSSDGLALARANHPSTWPPTIPPAVRDEDCGACTAEATCGCDGCDRSFCSDCVTLVAADVYLCPDCIGGAR